MADPVIEQIMVAAQARIAAAFPTATVRRSPDTEASTLDAIDLWDGDLRCETAGADRREYVAGVAVDLYAATSTLLNVRYAALVQALEADPPMGGLAVMVTETSRSTLRPGDVPGMRKAVGAAVEFEIAFWTRASDLTSVGPG